MLRHSIFVLISFFILGCGGVSYLPFPSGSKVENQQINDSDAMHRATMRPYTINGKTYYPTIVSIGDKASGTASWYGPNFHGKKTSNGEIYNMHALTAAHKTLPMNTMLRVTNLKNNRQVIVRVNDRGPFVSDRIIDLSKSAAAKIDMINSGTAPVLLEVIGFNAKINGASRFKNTNVAKEQTKKPEAKVIGGTSVVVISSKTQAEPSEVVGGNFMVQIGSFSSIDGAKSYQKTHENIDGYKSVIRQFYVGDRPVYKVFLTGFASEDEARDFARNGRFAGAFIVRG